MSGPELSIVIPCYNEEDNVRAISFYESQGMLRDGARQTVTIEIPLQTVRCVTIL